MDEQHVFFHGRDRYFIQNIIMKNNSIIKKTTTFFVVKFLYLSLLTGFCLWCCCVIVAMHVANWFPVLIDVDACGCGGPCARMWGLCAHVFSRRKPDS